MRKFIYFLFFALILSACSTEEKVKETVSEHLKKQLKNPDSFKIESIEIKKDTVPAYLTKEMLSLAKEANEALSKFNRYKDMSYLWAKEKIESTTKMVEAADALEKAYDLSFEEKPSIEYIAFVKYSGTNSMGGTVSSRAIVIVDKEDPQKILGEFDIDEEFIENFMAIKYVGSKFKFELKQNKYGKIETEGLPYFEQFIFSGTD